MRLVGVEYTFDNSKLIFYFTCESRVDFRELVKDLASTFRTRIELRQIGIRDAAKLMGGLGVCGRKYCCAGFLSDFVQVTIKMAKEQNFSLNSAKVSGACGRLMCCIRYEHEAYEDALKVTPPVGTVVMTSEGEGTVIEIKPLAKEIKVKITDKEKDAIKNYKVSDVKILRTPKKIKTQENGDEDVIPED
jgi:cell fate regulator YaaT (PSP1 superfamily)